MAEIAFCCPACAHGVELREQSYGCTACGREYPILFGIPDFRLRSDRYLSLAEERAKAALLHRVAATMSFQELLGYYYRITEDVTVERAHRFASYVERGRGRGAIALDAFGTPASGDCLLDVGCGAGGALLAANAKFENIVGLDIALRWLIICRKRLEEAGVRAALVCADIASPPFAPGQFSHVLAMDVAEHVYDVGGMLSAIRSQLKPGGLVWLSANNRRWLGPHPAVGIWAASYLPPQLRATGKGDNRYDPLRFTAQLSPTMVRRACAAAGLEVVRVGPRRLDVSSGRGFARTFMEGYGALAANKITRPALTAFGPAFEVLARAF